MTGQELEYIKQVLLPELQERLQQWSEEYKHQPRDLGIRAEFVGLYRKARKLKSILWDGVNADAWREGTRTILMEVIGHALLALYDLDLEQAKQGGVDPVAVLEYMMERKASDGELGRAG